MASVNDMGLPPVIDDYSDNIDWDRIYKAFHDPQAVADRIRRAIEETGSPVAFCGFPEVASLLSAHYPIVFVDSAAAIVARSRARYPEIETVVASEITEFLRTHPVQSVVISGRLSAFWQTPLAFEQLAGAILSHPRSQVLIDYFDRESIFPGLRTSFSAPAGQGWWAYKEIESLPGTAPRIHTAKLEIGYSLGSTNFSYQTQRAYFERADMKSWHTRVFENYESAVHAGLIQNDPSFSIKMTGMPAACGR